MASSLRTYAPPKEAPAIGNTSAGRLSTSRDSRSILFQIMAHSGKSSGRSGMPIVLPGRGGSASRRSRAKGKGLRIKGFWDEVVHELRLPAVILEMGRTVSVTPLCLLLPFLYGLIEDERQQFDLV